MRHGNIGSVDVRVFRDADGVSRVVISQSGRTLFDRPAPNQAMPLDDVLDVHLYILEQSRQRQRRRSVSFD